MGAGVSYVLHLGDCLESLRGMADGSVQTCVTSPPYFGLRDYGHAGQIGLEPTPDAFVARLVDVFRDVRRVLRDDGTLWLNLGDSYAGSGRGGAAGGASSTLEGGQETQGAAPRRAVSDSQREHTPAVRGSRLPPGFHAEHFDAGVVGRAWVPPPPGFKQKDLIGIPWRVAFALQADGWYLRQDIIWRKPNPMPESVRDRCTKAHEYLFLLSKSLRYYFDAEAIAEPVAETTKSRLLQPGLASQLGSDRVPGKTNGAMKAVGDATGVRNKRSVWDVAMRPYKGAHFATFPPELVEPCVLAGAPTGGVVLDPFGGSGTTAGVAIALGRRAVLCELNPEYAALMPKRIASIVADYAAQAREAGVPHPAIEVERENALQLDMFGALA